MALSLALFLAGAATYLLYSRLRRGVARPQMTMVIAAVKDLPAGVALTKDDLTAIDWPSSVPLAGSFSQVDKVVGRPLIYPLQAREPVLERELAVPGSGIGLSVKIPPGMRATSVRSNEIVGVAGFLFPGSHVDVLATYSPPGATSPITQTVLQNVEVLTAGEKLEPDPQGKPQTVTVVTLLLNPDDSQKLLLTSTQGTIQFVLRSGADTGKVNLNPTRLDQLVATNKPPAPSPAVPVRARKRVKQQEVAPAPKPPDVYLLEVIEGDKKSVEKF